MTNTEARRALATICAAIHEAIKVAGPQGAPGGILYMALMGMGCTLDQFEQIMSAMCLTGEVHKRGLCYFDGPATAKVVS